jgi:hypothetical protein
MRQIDPVKVKIEMLRKGIKRAKLKKRFRVKDPAISLALSGARPTLLKKIADYVKAA